MNEMASAFYAQNKQAGVVLNKKGCEHYATQLIAEAVALEAEAAAMVLRASTKRRLALDWAQVSKSQKPA